jgi:hypothetical protein
VPIVAKRLALLAAVLLIHGCTTVREQSFYVKEASLQEGARHRELAKRFVARKTHLDYDDKVFVVTGHRIAAGQGTVLAFRSFAPGSPFVVDQAGFFKITIYVPVATLSEGMELRVPGSDGALAFYSNGSSNFPGSGGCFGYASAGSIKVLKISQPDVTVRADLQFALSGPLGAALSDCEDKKVQSTYIARQVRLEEITPWQGKPGQHIYDETLAP